MKIKQIIIESLFTHEKCIEQLQIKKTSILYRMPVPNIAKYLYENFKKEIKDIVTLFYSKFNDTMLSVNSMGSKQTLITKSLSWIQASDYEWCSIYIKQNEIEVRVYGDGKLWSNNQGTEHSFHFKNNGEFKKYEIKFI